MRFLQSFTLFLTATAAISIPELDTTPANPLAIRHPSPDPRGGGGGRGGSSGGSSGGRSSGSSGGSRGSGSSGSSGSSPGRSPTSNVGGTSAGGSGVRPSYAGGRYAGGATTPYASGGRSPRGLAPAGLLIGGGLAFWFIAAGSLYSWGPYGAYRYNYPAQITYYNQTSMMNETVPGECLCRRYSGCSCEAAVSDGDMTQYVNSVVGDGSYRHQQDNQGTYQVQNVDGKRTFIVNGTLANGTTADSGESSAATGQNGLAQKASMLALVAVIGSAFFSL